MSVSFSSKARTMASPDASSRLQLFKFKERSVSFVFKDYANAMTPVLSVPFLVVSLLSRSRTLIDRLVAIN